MDAVVIVTALVTACGGLVAALVALWRQRGVAKKDAIDAFCDLVKEMKDNNVILREEYRKLQEKNSALYTRLDSLEEELSKTRREREQLSENVEKLERELAGIRQQVVEVRRLITRILTLVRDTLNAATNGSSMETLRGNLVLLVKLLDTLSELLEEE